VGEKDRVVAMIGSSGDRKTKGLPRMNTDFRDKAKQKLESV